MLSWLTDDGDAVTIEPLPYGVFSHHGSPLRVGAALGPFVVDIAAVLEDATFLRPTLNDFLAQGRQKWHDARARLIDRLFDARHADAVAPHVYRIEHVELSLPFAVSDYVDFYSSRFHAENVGRILRPTSEPLARNWLHLPVGYHGRSGTVVASGTDVRRPLGQRDDRDDGVVFAASHALDFEAEVGFVVGVGSKFGERVPISSFDEYVFGVVVVNDWSARDIQAFETVPLGPFLGKSFATSISSWVVPLEALDGSRIAPNEQIPSPVSYLIDEDPWTLDLQISISLNGTVISRPRFADVYWTPAQQLAHLTVNGAQLHTGDLFASGTVSGSSSETWGSLLELTANGTRPIELEGGSTRGFLEDGDEVAISASTDTVLLATVRGRVLPATAFPTASDETAAKRS